MLGPSFDISGPIFDLSILTLTNILRWMFIIGSIGFAMMGADKGLAKLGNERISERTFFLLAFVGGFWGIILGSLIFHHKTSKAGFMGIAILAALLWIAALSTYTLGLLKI